MRKPAYFRMRAVDIAAGLQLAYYAGNNHWTVQFEGAVLKVALEGPEQVYLDRLAGFFADGRVRKLDADR